MDEYRKIVRIAGHVGLVLMAVGLLAGLAGIYFGVAGELHMPAAKNTIIVGAVIMMFFFVGSIVDILNGNNKKNKNE